MTPERQAQARALFRRCLAYAHSWSFNERMDISAGMPNTPENAPITKLYNDIRAWLTAEERDDDPNSI